jgi:hypothetical protein
MTDIGKLEREVLNDEKIIGALNPTFAVLETINYLHSRGYLGGVSEWHPIDTAHKDGSLVMLYWPTMSICMYPAIGVHHGDEYGWEIISIPDYGEAFPTHWMPVPAVPKGVNNK